ncbi:hypothetical protein Q1695_007656 [Nippostrongylus brasiliensis]|nr:hypothetical protein Q1695_007656 [Nippostrongylus brasiliensis]
MQFLVLLALVGLSVQFPRQSSGYGDNNPQDVQYAAGRSPRNKNVDYTTGGEAPKPAHDAPARYTGLQIPANYGQNVIGNKIDAQTLGQLNNQGQTSVQKGGDQTNVGANNNQVNVGQQNNQGGNAGYKPAYDAPSYGANVPTYAAILVPNYGGNVVGNKIDTQNLGQVNNQGQSSVQKGGDQTNVGTNQNAVNVGQSNNQGGNAGYKPAYDAPSYGANVPTYAAILIPNYGQNVVGNKIDAQTLGQANNQGQSSVQKGGDQTNVGANSNAVNVGQTNNQGGNAGYKPAYDAPSYGANVPTYAAILIPNYGQNVVGNKIDAQTLGQANNQGQSSVQKGGDQTNVGANQNAVNVGQANNQGGNAGYKPAYDAPSYGANVPTYAAILIPNYGQNVVGNKIDAQTLGQANNQGQSSVQKGGDQTNVGANANTVNVGQANNQGGNAGYKPAYDAPSYGANVPTYAAILIPNYGQNVVGNKIDAQTLGQANNQGQSSVQKGGDQTNVGANANAVNVGQANNQRHQGGNVGSKPAYDAPSYGANIPTYAAILIPNYGGNVVGNKIDTQNLGQTNNQGQSSVQKGGDQTNVGANSNQVNVGQANNQGKGVGPAYDAPRYYAGNKVGSQNLGQGSTQGQGNYQQGGAQGNYGYNQNTVNVSQTNNQSVNIKKKTA